MSTRRRRSVAVAAIVAILTVVSVGAAFAHDLFLKPATFFVTPNSDVLVRVINGTFTKSENAIARARLADVSVVGPSGRQQVDTAHWTATGDTSTLRFRTGAPGTYVVGASTKPSIISLTAKDFNAYLQEDGIADMLEARRRDGELDRPAKERYAKHVKTLIQVGDARTASFGTVLGYPAELVPLDNPYVLSAGGTMRVRVLANGGAVASQQVLYGGLAPNGDAIAERSTRSDADGNASIPLRARGAWYVKFVRMYRPQPGSDSVTHVSSWATLTFEVR